MFVVALTRMMAGVALAQSEDLARVFERQTQELLNAVTAGDVQVWDGYLDPKVIFLRGADGRITGFVNRREGRDVPWSKVQ